MRYQNYLISRHLINKENMPITDLILRIAVSNNCFECLNKPDNGVMDCAAVKTLTPAGSGRWLITGSCNSGVTLSQEEVVGDQYDVSGYATS